MKNSTYLFGFILLLSSATAKAHEYLPAVGDRVVYSHYIEKPSQKFTRSIEIINFDSNTNIYTFRESRIDNGVETSSTNRTVEASSLNSLYLSNPVSVDDCYNFQKLTGIPGTIVSIAKVSVSAGSFDTCEIGDMMTVSYWTYNYGQVPFGLIHSKSVDFNGKATIVDLLSFEKH